MKKLFALALTLVLLFVMAAPVMAAGGEDAVSLCAVCTGGNHTMVEAYVSYSDWEYVSNSTHSYTKTIHYICSRCNYYSYPGAPTYGTGAHRSSGTPTLATCNGTTQTRYYDCTDCGFEFAVSKRCPAATHTGTCLWL